METDTVLKIAIHFTFSTHIDCSRFSTTDDKLNALQR